MFRWVAGVTADEVLRVSARLNELPAAIPEIAQYRHGPDAGINEGNFDYVVVADFISTEDYLVYRDHPIHRQVITDVLSPLIATRSAVQYHVK